MHFSGAKDPARGSIRILRERDDIIFIKASLSSRYVIFKKGAFIMWGLHFVKSNGKTPDQCV